GISVDVRGIQVRAGVAIAEVPVISSCATAQVGEGDGQGRNAAGWAAGKGGNDRWRRTSDDDVVGLSEGISAAQAKSGKTNVVTAGIGIDVGGVLVRAGVAIAEVPVVTGCAAAEVGEGDGQGRNAAGWAGRKGCNHGRCGI